MLLIVEKGIREGICHAIHRHATADNNYKIIYDEDKESSHILCILSYISFPRCK